MTRFQRICKFIIRALQSKRVKWSSGILCTLSFLVSGIIQKDVLDLVTAGLFALFFLTEWVGERVDQKAKALKEKSLQEIIWFPISEKLYKEYTLYAPSVDATEFYDTVDDCIDQIIQETPEVFVEAIRKTLPLRIIGFSEYRPHPEDCSFLPSLVQSIDQDFSDNNGPSINKEGLLELQLAETAFITRFLELYECQRIIPEATLVVSAHQWLMNQRPRHFKKICREVLDVDPEVISHQSSF